MPLLIIQWFFGPVGRYVALALAVTAALGVFMHHERSIGAANFQTKIELQNKEADHEADGIRSGVFRDCSVTPPPTECLRDGWTRDN